MNEVNFIRASKERWRALEGYLKSTTNLMPERTVELYQSCADDLSFMKTHFPDSTSIAYLESLVVRTHRMIYSGSIIDRKRIWTYWTYDIPEAIWQSRRDIFISFIIFIIAILIGWFSSIVDPAFARLVLGDLYVNITLENIDKGDPMAIYSSMEESQMFLGIGANNVRVAFLAFALGMLTSVGPALILLTNGVMVGTFFYFFYERGLTFLAFSTIMIHGTLELSAIGIAGGAGMVLGQALLYPGTYTRIRSLQKAGGRSVKVMISLIPVFIIAAFLESYLTRQYMTLGGGGRMLIIILSLIALGYCYYYYPSRLHLKKAFSK